VQEARQSIDELNVQMSNYVAEQTEMRKEVDMAKKKYEDISAEANMQISSCILS